MKFYIKNSVIRLVWVSIITLAGFLSSSVSCAIEPDKLQEDTLELTEGRLGMNMSSLNYYTGFYPFKNYFKDAWLWIEFVNGSKANEATSLGVEQDDNDYIRQLKTGQTFRSYLGIHPNFPAGRYILMYDGEGELNFRMRNGAAIIIEKSEPGKKIILIPDGKGKGMQIDLVSVNPENYIRNIRFVSEEFASDDLEADPWHPLFLKMFADFPVIRFMGWSKVNTLPIKEWHELPPVGYYSYTQVVPFQLMVDLCNKKNIYGWFNVHFGASNDYIKEMATYLRNNLDQHLEFAIEYANECWHPGFPSRKYCQEQGRLLGLGTNPNDQRIAYYSHRSGEIFDIFRNEFDTEANKRITCVMTGSKGDSYYSNKILSSVGGQKADALAIAPYFGGKAPNKIKSGELEPTLDAIFQYCRNDINNLFGNGIPDNANTAKKYGKKFIAYEAGPHLTPKGDITIGEYGGNSSTTLVELCREASFHPEMKNLITSYLENWKNAGNGLIMHFFCAATHGENNMMGLVDYMFDDTLQSPKYMAIKEWKAKNPYWDDFATNIKHVYNDFIISPIIFPNPVYSGQNIYLENAENASDWELCNAYGQVIAKGSLD